MPVGYRLIVLFIFSLFVVVPINAQIYVQRNYGVEDGLPQSQVRAVYEDLDGFIWIGTMGGLSKWDGFQFKNYFQKDGLPSSIIYDIRQYENGNLFVATHAGLAAVKNDSVITPMFHKRKFDFPISVLREGSNGEIILGSLGKGIFIIKQDSILHFNTENGLSNNNVRDIAISNDGTLYVATRHGLNIIRQNQVQSYFTEDGLSNNYVHSLIVKKNGSVLIGTLTGIDLYQNDTITKIFDSATVRFTRMFKMREDALGNLYCANWGTGIYRISGSGEVRHYDTSNGLMSNNAYNLLISSCGTILVGLDGGLSLIHPDGIFWYGKKDGIADPRVWKILEWEKGNILFTTSSGLYQLKNNRIEFLASSDLVNHGNLYAMVKLDEHTALMGGSTGLWKYDKGNNQFVRVHESLNSVVVLDLVKDVKGDIWAATYGSGLWVSHSGKAWESLNKKFNLPTNRFFISVPMKDSSVWCGSDGAGIFVFKNGNYHQINDVQGLANNHIYAIAEMGDNSVFIGHDKGFSIFRNDSIANYTQIGDQSFNSVFGFLEDRKTNQVFMGTEKGVIVIDQNNKPWEAFRLSASDGLNSDELNQGAYCAGFDGSQYWGSIKGLNVIPPTAVTAHDMPPKIHITGIKLFGKPIVFQKKLELNHNQNYLRIHYVGIDLGSPEDVVYEYQMKNLDPLPTRTSLTEVQYPNLLPGKYEFVVRAMSKWGVWSNPQTINIEVHPVWYKTPWAFAAYVLIIGLLIVLLFKFQMNRIKEKEYLKQTELKARAMEAEKKILKAESERKSQELIRAREIQKMMLPVNIPQLPFMEIAFSIETAREVGGNYYDFFLRDEESIYVMVGGASGHGMPAGMMVALTKSALKTMGARPTQLILKRLNYVLKDIIPEKLHMSLTLGLFTRNAVEFSMAAMPPTLKWSAKEARVEEISMVGLPLGFMETADYDNQKIEMNPGDIVVIFTNGLPAIENRAHENLGYEAIKKVLQNSNELSAKGITDKLMALANGFRQDALLTDDITILTVKYH